MFTLVGSGPMGNNTSPLESPLMSKVPYSNLTSYYVTRADRRAIDVRLAGVPECIVAGWTSYRHAYPPLPEHQHFGVAELAYAETGRQPYAVANHPFTLQGGEGIAIPPDTPHSSDGHPSYPGKRFWIQLRLPSSEEYPWLGLTASEAAPLVEMLQRPAVRGVKWPADFSRRISALFDVFDRPAAPVRTAMLRNGLLSLLFDLLNAQVQETLPADQTRIRRAIAWLEAETELPATLEQFAEASGLSASSFNRVFKEVVGITPHAFILRKRIDRAQRLLQAGQGSITDIAFACGFSSSQYFATVFKRIVGITPNALLTKHDVPLPSEADGQ